MSKKALLLGGLAMSGLYYMYKLYFEEDKIEDA